MEPSLLDDVIGRLLEVRTGTWRQVQLSESEIRELCLVSGEIFLQQPNLLELEAPMKVCGDIHGQYLDLLRLFEYGGYPPQANYLFMGNYVDYGKQSLETMCLLLAYKIKYPENFFLLRGNHENVTTNRIYGFYDECKRRYNVQVWKMFNQCFNCLPTAALIDDKVLCVHGGLSPDLYSLDQIRNLLRPTVVPDSGLLCDLLWSDPNSTIQGWGMNDRGISYTFGPDKVSEFLAKNDLDLICRSNQIVEDGYEFFADRQLVTIFSAPNFRGEYDNAGTMMSIDENLMCSFQIMMPTERKFKYSDASTNSSKFPSGTRFGGKAKPKPGNSSNGANNIAESSPGTWMKAAKSITSLWGPSVGSRTTVKPENTSTGGKGVVKRADDAPTDDAESVSSPSTPSSDNTTIGKPGNTPAGINTGIGSAASNPVRPRATAIRHDSPGGTRAVHFRMGEYVGQSAKAVTRAVSPFNPERDGRRR